MQEALQRLPMPRRAGRKAAQRRIMAALRGRQTKSGALTFTNDDRCPPFICSLTLLETGERNFKVLFLFSKLEKRISNFSFSSRFDFLASRQCLTSPTSPYLALKKLSGHKKLSAIRSYVAIKSNPAIEIILP